MSLPGPSDVPDVVSTASDAPIEDGTSEGSPDHDLLTGLPTRPVLHRRLSHALVSAIRGGPQPALLTLDLDRFQEVNDSTGLATGDGVLRRVAQRIQGAVPPGSTVARISGDEFAVLLPDVRTGAVIAARLVELIGRPYAVNGHAVSISVSVGIAFAPEHGQEADDLLRAATIALHRAEAEGKNHWVQFEPWMQETAKARQTLETDLRAALALNRVEFRKAMAIDQFEVHYQPQVAADGYQLTGFEALVRWRHPRRGLVSPAEFIPLAEEIGLIGLLGDWVLHTACLAAARWPIPSHGKALQIAVNVSPLQLRERRALVASVVDSLAVAGLAADRLEIEITESALMGDAKDTLRAIKDLGVALALDDFGTGYSSLSQLAHYPFDRLKIDRSFVLDLPDGADSVGRDAVQAKWMIQAIAALGHGLGMSTIAEGVETEAQAEMLRQAGVTEFQGYLVSRPVPSDDVEALIRRFDDLQQRTTHIFPEFNDADATLQPRVLQP